MSVGDTSQVSEPGLFAEPERLPGAVPVPDTRTVAERRRDRHADALRHGQHPLSVALRWPIPLHADARRDADRTADGSPRCGGCVHRELLGAHTAKSYPKCVAEGHDRITGGPGTDVAAWWPACTLYAAAGAS